MRTTGVLFLADARIDRGRKVVYNLPTVNIRTGLHKITRDI